MGTEYMGNLPFSRTESELSTATMGQPNSRTSRAVADWLIRPRHKEPVHLRDSYFDVLRLSWPGYRRVGPSTSSGRVSIAGSPDGVPRRRQA